MTADRANGAAGLYREELLRHAKAPAGAATVGRDEAGCVRKVNPACGDEVRLRLVRDGAGRIARVEHQTRGCAVCVASASMLAEAAAAHGGWTAEEAAARAESFFGRLEAGAFGEEDGALQALNGLAKFPARLACARLAWEALLEAAGR